MTISHKQALLARVGLGYSMQNISDLFGFSKSQISDFENNGKGLSDDRIFELASLYRQKGVVFIGSSGVDFRDEYQYKLSGQAGFIEFMEDVYATARDHGGEFCIFNGSPDLIIKWTGEEWYKHHRQRMTEVRSNIDFKVIVEEGTKNLIGNDFVEYRYWPSDRFLPETIYIYGKKLAFLSFSEHNVEVTVNISEKIADSMRFLFASAWKEAQK